MAVSDQSRAVTVMTCPPCEIRCASILVKGHGPAMQDTRTLRNSFPGPASRVVEPSAAFHLPSGEHGCWPLQGTLPLFWISNVCTALPTFTSVRLLMEYRNRTLLTFISGFPVGRVAFSGSGSIRTT